MLTFDGPVEAIDALQDFIIDRTAPLPSRLRDRLRETLKERSPVVGVIRAIELVYARDSRKEDVPEQMRDWGAAAAAMAEVHGFHAFDLESRGTRIAKVLRRQAISQANTPQLDEVVAELAAPLPLPDDAEIIADGEAAAAETEAEALADAPAGVEDATAETAPTE